MSTWVAHHGLVRARRRALGHLVGRGGRLRGLLVALVLLLQARSARATPAFARREHLPCSACHTAFPELNQVGQDYKEAGYRIANGDGTVTTNGLDLGNGWILDPFPPVAVVLNSTLARWDASQRKQEQLTTQPLDELELVIAGIGGKHFSYTAHVGTSADDDYVPAASGVVQYRFDDHATLFAGYVPLFNRDPYDTLNEARRLTEADYAFDYAGSLDLPLSTEGELLGAYGRAGPLFWLGEVTPGPGVIDGVGEPLDVVARVALAPSPPVEVGAFWYRGATDVGSTERIGADLDLLGHAGNWKVVGLYDARDQAVLAGVGWDTVADVGSAALVPLARLDLTATPDTLGLEPTVALGLQEAIGRLQLDLTEQLGSGQGLPPPILVLHLLAVF